MKTTGALLAIGLVLLASLTCVVHWLVVDAPQVDGVALGGQVTVQRVQHAAELWSAAPCTCETQHVPAPTHVEPGAPAIVLLAGTIVLTAGWSRACELVLRPVVPRGLGVVPTTPPPQA